MDYEINNDEIIGNILSYLRRLKIQKSLLKDEDKQLPSIIEGI